MNQAPVLPAVAAAKKSNFFLGFVFLPARKRAALERVYGFCRLMDDIVDSQELKADEAARMLDFWRQELDRTFAGSPTHSLTQQLLPDVREFNLPKQPFLDLISGVELDLKKKEYDDFARLEEYLYGVAVTVGLLCVEIFGYEHTPAADVREYAKNMGYAFQLTNIIRDVGADLELGRIYLPKADIAAAGYSIDALRHRDHSAAFERLMAKEYERAKTFYSRARNLLRPEDRPSMLPAEIMARLYEGLLDHIADHGFRVFFDKARLPAWRKAAEVISACAYSYGLV